MSDYIYYICVYVDIPIYTQYSFWKKYYFKNKK